MKKTITTILALLAALAAPSVAVPLGINYQGALTDDQGNPVTGTRMMSIKLFGAATGGAQLYTEDIGTVDVSDGVFSFEFGTSGTSNAEQSDTVALTDGTATTFQKVVSAAEVVAGSVSVSDGTYTWSQSGGSSNEDDFSVVYSTNLRRVTVTYLNGAPAAGRTITTTYLCPSSGISGALAGDNQPWAEITVDGVAQVPRQKILTVPFAVSSAEAISAKTIEGVLKSREQRVGRFFTMRSWNNGGTSLLGLPFQYTPSGTTSFDVSFGGNFNDVLPQLVSTQIYLPIPCNVVGLKASVVDTATQTSSAGSYSLGKVTVTLWHKAADDSDEALLTLDSGSAFNGGAAELTAVLNKHYDGSNIFWITIDAPVVRPAPQNSSVTVNGQLKVNWVKLLFEQIEGN